MIVIKQRQDEKDEGKGLQLPNAPRSHEGKRKADRGRGRETEKRGLLWLKDNYVCASTSLCWSVSGSGCPLLLPGQHIGTMPPLLGRAEAHLIVRLHSHLLFTPVFAVISLHHATALIAKEEGRGIFISIILSLSWWPIGRPLWYQRFIMCGWCMKQSLL